MLRFASWLIKWFSRSTNLSLFIKPSKLNTEERTFNCQTQLFRNRSFKWKNVLILRLIFARRITTWPVVLRFLSHSVSCNIARKTRYKFTSKNCRIHRRPINAKRIKRYNCNFLSFIFEISTTNIFRIYSLRKCLPLTKRRKKERAYRDCCRC